VSAEKLLRSYEREHNGGKPILVWNSRGVAGLLTIHIQTARRYMRNIEYLGRFSYRIGGGKKPRLVIERDNLICALNARLEPVRQRDEEWDANRAAEVLFGRAS